MRIKGVDESISGRYACIAINDVGTVENDFEINVECNLIKG
jgi:hypothetical protein